MIREIVNIDEEKCNGCGLCIPNCHEGALQIIDGKVRLISDLLCDGLGACIGHCPLGAITIEKREAEAYDEVKVMQIMVMEKKRLRRLVRTKCMMLLQVRSLTGSRSFMILYIPSNLIH